MLDELGLKETPGGMIDESGQGYVFFRDHRLLSIGRDTHSRLR